MTPITNVCQTKRNAFDTRVLTVIVTNILSVFLQQGMLGVCVPEQCKEDDIRPVLQEIFSYVSPGKHIIVWKALNNIYRASQ